MSVDKSGRWANALRSLAKKFYSSEMCQLSWANWWWFIMVSEMKWPDYGDVGVRSADFAYFIMAKKNRLENEDRDE